MADIIDIATIRNNKDVHPLLRVQDDSGVWWYQFCFQYPHEEELGTRHYDFTFWAKSMDDAIKRIESIRICMNQYEQEKSLYPMMLCESDVWQ